MNILQVERMIDGLSQIFDVVRLVDVSLMTQYTIENHKLCAEDYKCYAVWHKCNRCENCISSKVFASKTKLTKFEFIDNDIYYVIAKYLEIDNEEYVLEMVSKLSDDILFGAFGEHQFVDIINRQNERLYIDPLTGVYNKQYYLEQLQHFKNASCIAMIDVNDFKIINDTCGHLIGDQALIAIADCLKNNFRESDNVIRFGGDEFCLICNDGDFEVINKKMQNLKKKVNEIKIPDHPEITLSISIGVAIPQLLDSNTDIIKVADAALYEDKKNKYC